MIMVYLVYGTHNILNVKRHIFSPMKGLTPHKHDITILYSLCILSRLCLKLSLNRIIEVYINTLTDDFKLILIINWGYVKLN